MGINRAKIMIDKIANYTARAIRLEERIKSAHSPSLIEQLGRIAANWRKMAEDEKLRLAKAEEG